MMAHTMLTEEDLQQSAALSDDDSQFAADGQTHTSNEIHTSAFAANGDVATSTLSRSGDEAPDVNMEDGDGESEDDMSGHEGQEQGEAEDDVESSSIQDHGDGLEDEEDDEDQEAEGEPDDEFDVAGDGGSLNGRSRRVDDVPMEELSDEGEEDDDGEGVGAVKIKPGDTDDEDEEDEDGAVSEASGLQSAGEEESEEDAAWEENAEIEDDDSDNETPSNTCMFCKQDEEHDPSDEFEAYLACSRCGENAHQQCAREAVAMMRGTYNWMCPECMEAEDQDEDDEDGEGGEDVAARAERDERDQRNEGGERDVGVESDEGDEGDEGDEVTSPTSPRSAPKLTRDLLPSQRGGIKPDSHSVFNQLVIDGDPMDGSRLLRKRKTSSVDADETVMSLRKRRRRNSDEAKAQQDDTAGTDTSRPQRQKTSRNGTVAVKRGHQSIMVAMHVGPGPLRDILARPSLAERKRGSRGGGAGGAGGPGGPGSSRRARARASAARAREDKTEAMVAPFVSATYSQPFYSFFDKETDELKGKPYGGILSEAEADTAKTLPANDDRRRFDEAKQRAEEEWRARVLAMQAEAQVPAKKSRKSSGPASQIECIEFGGWEIDTWYAAPYPEEYSRNRVLYICEFCLKYMNSDYVAWRHKLKCPAKHPPGDEIYRHGSVSVFEVDGRKNPVYCQNLCLLAKLFLGSKTLYYDVEPFLFYVLCEYDDLGYHFVGYFSKEKRPSSQNNVSCILTLPIHQRKGYGNLLIDFSYLLTRVEQKTGSPEKPLSDMGLVSYRNYWRLVMCQYLLDHTDHADHADHASHAGHAGHANHVGPNGLSVRQISEDTGLTADDVISALEGLRCLVRDPQTGLYGFRVDLTYCRDYVAKWESKNYVKLNRTALTWTPYVMRGSANNFELGPAINALAPREEDEARAVNPAAGVAGRTGAGARTEVRAEAKAEGGSTAQLPNGHAVQEEADGEKEASALLDDVISSTEPQGKADHATSGRPGRPGRSQLPPDQWTSLYRDIPPSRFDVFPPAAGGRRLDRPRPTPVRNPVSRTLSSASRPRSSTGGSSSRRSATRPRSSTSRRKSGGTGRGPGRWPKGTKKSDYGNADSGPGLPPAWIQARVKAAKMSSLKPDNQEDETASSADEGKEMQDVVQVQVPILVPTLANDKRTVPTGASAGSATGAEMQQANGDEEEEEEEEEDQVIVKAGEAMVLGGSP